MHLTLTSSVLSPQRGFSSKRLLRDPRIFTVCCVAFSNRGYRPPSPPPHPPCLLRLRLASASVRGTGLKIVIKFMLHSPDLEPVLAMQDTMLKTLIAVARGKGTECQVRWQLLLFYTGSVYITRMFQGKEHIVCTKNVSLRRCLETHVMPW